MQSEVGLTEFSNIRSGGPQGSILGPTFFPIFINDPPPHFEFCLSDFYADDGTVNTNDKKLDRVECKLQGELGNAKHWSKKTCFRPNITKKHMYGFRYQKAT